MVVHNLDIVGVSVFPSKANAPLLIDPNAVKPFEVSRQGFKAVGRRDQQVLQTCGRIDHEEFPKSGPLDVRRQFA